MVKNGKELEVLPPDLGFSLRGPEYSYNILIKLFTKKYFKCGKYNVYRSTRMNLNSKMFEYLELNLLHIS